MTTLRLGNSAPIEHLHVPAESEDDEPRRVRQAVAIPDGDEHAVTEVRFADGMPLVDMLTAVTSPGTGVWDNHSDAHPVWVSSDNDRLAELLAEHYSNDEHTCEVVPFDDDTPVGVTPPDEHPDDRKASRPRGSRSRRHAPQD